MSINWVMLEGSSFTPLPEEQTVFSSPASGRTTLSLQSLNKFPGREPFAVSTTGGRVFLTNRRIVYLANPTTPQLQSFAAPLLKLHDSHVTTPFFGPNAWIATVQPVPNGGIPSHHLAVELKMTFKDGGAYDFHTKFVQIKERLQQAVEVARENGSSGVDRNGATGISNGVDLSNVHLEQLPAYEEAAYTSQPLPRPIDRTTSVVDRAPAPIGPTPETLSGPTQPQGSLGPPAEPPPGYEEAQRDSVAERLERDLLLDQR